MPERIEAVAIRAADGTIYSLPRPARHADVIAVIHAAGVSRIGRTQGFVTDAGRFVDRLEARRIAAAAGQVRPRDGWPWSGSSLALLFSEDVW